MTLIFSLFDIVSWNREIVVPYRRYHYTRLQTLFDLLLGVSWTNAYTNFWSLCTKNHAWCAFPQHNFFLNLVCKMTIRNCFFHYWKSASVPSFNKYCQIVWILWDKEKNINDDKKKTRLSINIAWKCVVGNLKNHVNTDWQINTLSVFFIFFYLGVVLYMFL